MRLIAALMVLTAFASPGAAGEGWVRMFDGKSLAGWKAAERPENWSVEDGVIVGRGERSHLFYMTRQCRDCEFKADVKINDGGNSGMYFRVGFEPGWPKGYEAQVNSTHTDPRRTGGASTSLSKGTVSSSKSTTRSWSTIPTKRIDTPKVIWPSSSTIREASFTTRT